jgi:hypothetical protein
VDIFAVFALDRGDSHAAELVHYSVPILQTEEAMDVHE